MLNLQRDEQYQGPIHGPPSQDTRCPVTVLTGFLGSGKTTLLNAVIRERRDLRIAVIVNEFGELGIDSDLIEASEEDIIELSNGCLCCAVRGDLLEACERLTRQRSRFDWLVIETSGLADPVPIAQSFLLEDGPREAFRLDGILTLVDACNFTGQLKQGETVARQVTLADRILLTKTDAVRPTDVENVMSILRRLNPGAEIISPSGDNPGTQAIFGLFAYELESVPAQLRFASPPKHDGALRAECFTFEQPFDFIRFSRFMRLLLSRIGSDLLRVKGILELSGEDRRFVFHGVQTMIDGDIIGIWGEGLRRSKLVFIGRNIHREELEAQLLECLA